MILRKKKEINDNVIKSSIFIEEVSVSDEKLFSVYGEPQINLGGSISETFDLPPIFVKLFSQSPHVLELDNDQESRTNLSSWNTFMATQIIGAMNTLRSSAVDDFIGETIITV